MLKGKAAIITGGVRGIGKAIAREFCENGADVLLCYRSNDEQARKTAEELAGFGTRVELLKGDVADPETAKAAVAKAKECFGPVSYTHLDVYKRQTSRWLVGSSKSSRLLSRLISLQRRTFACSPPLKTRT